MNKGAIRLEFDGASLSYALTMIRLGDGFVLGGDSQAACLAYQQAEYALRPHALVSQSLKRLLVRAASGKLAARSKLFPVSATALARLGREHNRLLSVDVLSETVELGRELLRAGRPKAAEWLAAHLVDAFHAVGNTQGPGYGETLMLRADICRSQGDDAGFAHWASLAAPIYEAGMPNFS